MALVQQLPLELKIELARYTSRPAWQLVHDELLTMTRVIAEFLRHGVPSIRISAQVFYYQLVDGLIVVLPRWVAHTNYPGIRNIYKARKICQRVTGWGDISITNLVDDIVA